MDLQICADCGPTLWEILLPLLLGSVAFVFALEAHRRGAKRLIVVLLAGIAVALLWVMASRLLQPW